MELNHGERDGPCAGAIGADRIYHLMSRAASHGVVVVDVAKCVCVCLCI